MIHPEYIIIEANHSSLLPSLYVLIICQTPHLLQVLHHSQLGPHLHPRWHYFSYEVLGFIETANPNVNPWVFQQILETFYADLRRAELLNELYLFLDELMNKGTTLQLPRGFSMQMLAKILGLETLALARLWVLTVDWGSQVEDVLRSWHFGENRDFQLLRLAGRGEKIGLFQGKRKGLCAVRELIEATKSSCLILHLLHIHIIHVLEQIHRVLLLIVIIPGITIEEISWARQVVLKVLVVVAVIGKIMVWHCFYYNRKWESITKKDRVCEGKQRSWC